MKGIIGNKWIGDERMKKKMKKIKAFRAIRYILTILASNRFSLQSSITTYAQKLAKSALIVIIPAIKTVLLFSKLSAKSE